MARKSQARKARKNTTFDSQYLATIVNDAKAISEGPRRKKWTVHDIKAIQPKTETQTEFFQSYFYGNNVVASGFPGTGKTYISMWLALQSVFSAEQKQDRLVIVRSAVASREIGFLPGTKEEKMEPFELPYKDIVADLIGKGNAYEDMRDAGKIEFMPTSYLRGLTWDNAVVIVDEIQNMSWMEIHTVMTRLGKNSRIIVCGDISQNDLAGKRLEETGMGNFLRVAEYMKSFDIVHFTKHDVVRSGFTRDWILAKEELCL